MTAAESKHTKVHARTHARAHTHTLTLTLTHTHTHTHTHTRAIFRRKLAGTAAAEAQRGMQTSPVSGDGHDLGIFSRLPPSGGR